VFVDAGLECRAAAYLLSYMIVFLEDLAAQCVIKYLLTASCKIIAAGPRDAAASLFSISLELSLSKNTSNRLKIHHPSGETPDEALNRRS